MKNLLRASAVLVAALLIAVATLRSGGEVVEGGSMCVACGVRGVADFAANVILFAPLGFALAWCGLRAGPALAIGFVYSAAIEAAQLTVLTGRHATIGDLVANSLGALAGAVFFTLRPWRWARSLRTGPALAVSLAATSILLLGLLLFTPVISKPTYHMLWKPDYDGHELFYGTVLSTKLGDLRWQQPGPMYPDTTVQRLLQIAPLDFRFVAGPLPRQLAPIITVHDGFGKEIMLLGQLGEDFVFRYWTLADEFRMDHADLRIPHAFRNQQAGDTVDFAFTLQKDGYCAKINGRGMCGPGFTVGKTWSILMSLDVRSASSKHVGFLWLLAVFMPIGFAAADRRALAAVGIASTIILVLVPQLMGFAMTPWYELVGAWVGLIVGQLVAKGVRLSPHTAARAADRAEHSAR